jgi:hypothetical protein
MTLRLRPGSSEITSPQGGMPRKLLYRVNSVEPGLLDIQIGYAKRPVLLTTTESETRRGGE